VKVRSDADPGVDLWQYQTYDFFSQMGIEGDNYRTRSGISAPQSARRWMGAGTASPTPRNCW
jgi:hypothetical protein